MRKQGLLGIGNPDCCVCDAPCTPTHHHHEICEQHFYNIMADRSSTVLLNSIEEKVKGLPRVIQTSTSGFDIKGDTGRLILRAEVLNIIHMTEIGE